ncbi:MAG: hypothetical protein K9I36_07435 [Bacteroidia bacterium]|nr:hypothetical protein [Bacteroidia bacterium]MCF8426548.1 hypothetical protein [Bacteroidia bacterium]
MPEREDLKFFKIRFEPKSEAIAYIRSENISMKNIRFILIPVMVFLFSGCFDSIENPCEYTTENYTLPGETDIWLGKLPNTTGTTSITYKNSAGSINSGSLYFYNNSDYNSDNCKTYYYSQRTYSYSFVGAAILLSVGYRGAQITDNSGNTFRLKYNDKIDLGINYNLYESTNSKTKQVKIGLPLWPSFDSNVVVFKTIGQYYYNDEPTDISLSKNRYTYIGTLVKNGKTYENVYKITNDLVDSNKPKDYQYFILDKEYGLLEYKTNEDTYTVIYP